MMKSLNLMIYRKIWTENEVLWLIRRDVTLIKNYDIYSELTLLWEVVIKYHIWEDGKINIPWSGVQLNGNHRCTIFPIMDCRWFRHYVQNIGVLDLTNSWSEKSLVWHTCRMWGSKSIKRKLDFWFVNNQVYIIDVDDTREPLMYPNWTLIQVEYMQSTKPKNKKS